MNNKGQTLIVDSAIPSILLLIGLVITAKIFPDFLWIWIIVIAIMSIPMVLVISIIPLGIYVLLKRKFFNKNYAMNERVVTFVLCNIVFWGSIVVQSLFFGDEIRKYNYFLMTCIMAYSFLLLIAAYYFSIDGRDVMSNE